MDPYLSPFNVTACDAEKHAAHESIRRGVSLPLAGSAFIHLMVFLALLMLNRVGLSSSTLGKTVIRVALVDISDAGEMAAEVEAAAPPEVKKPAETPRSEIATKPIITATKKSKPSTPTAGMPDRSLRLDGTGTNAVPVSTGDEISPGNPTAEPLEITTGREDETATGRMNSGPSSGGGGDTETISRRKYLDENFFYIQELISRNLSYPPAARRMKQQGTVMVSFFILESGMVENISVVTGSGYKLLGDHAVEHRAEAARFDVGAPPGQCFEFFIRQRELVIGIESGDGFR